jgi:tetratricopeptide (TPR) repeat protein
MRKIFTALCCVLLALPALGQPNLPRPLPSIPKPAPRATTPAHVAERAAAGREARDAGDFAHARELFTSALKDTQDADLGARLSFDLALTYQLQAEAEGDAVPLLRRAVFYYDQTRKARPGSAATLCNQARAYARLGDWTQAEQGYRDAAALPGDDQPFYQTKYAEYLASQGNWDGAQQIYEQAALARLQSTEAHEILVGRFKEQLAQGRHGGSAYLWRLVEAGAGLRAAETAVELMAGVPNPIGLQDSGDLMAIVAAGLGRSPLDPASFRTTPIAKRLIELSRHPAFGLPAKEILDLVHAEPSTPERMLARLAWWRTEPPWAGGDPPHGMWPTQAMQSLLLALGQGHEQRGAFSAAESHYRAAMLLVPNEADPTAARQLIDLFVAQNQLGEVERLLADYEIVLFEGKGRAYRQSQLLEIYDFHTTLGSLYGYLASKGQRDWGDSFDIHSAVFQLERAVEIGKRIDEETPASLVGAKKVHLEPKTVDYLARAYQAKGQAKRGVEVRFEAAHRFLVVGNASASKLVLEPVTTPIEQRKLKSGELKLNDELLRKLRADKIDSKPSG